MTGVYSSSHLTIHSSRSRFAARLNSGVRPTTNYLCNLIFYRMKFYAILVCFLLLVNGSVAASGKTKIDGSTEQTTTASIQTMRADLSNKENCLLSTALLRIQIADQKKIATETGNADASASAVGPKISGMTYSQIIAFSETFPPGVVGLCRE
jgi:hypothetical protein